ncbi:MAG: carboxypeptidase regulatory-like domain-containing protein [Planctomycetota bacterium]
MKSVRDKFGVLIILCIIALCSEVGMSAIQVGDSEPAKDHGWPAGSVELANLPSRFIWWEGPPAGGGERHFHYRCQDTDEFNQALTTFAAIRASRLELVIHNGPKEEKDPEERADWTFTVWNPESWDCRHNKPKSAFYLDRKPVPAPRIDLYVGDGAVAWEKVKVPQNIRVVDKRPGSMSPEFAGGGLVRGKVFDLATGKPIAGAEIVLQKRFGGPDEQSFARAVTDAKGHCQIANIPPAYYRIVVKAEGYVSREEHFDNDPVEYYSVTASVSRGSYVKGIVTDPDGNPAEGIEVSVRDCIGIDGLGYPCSDEKATTTDKQGRFEIREVPVGFACVDCRSSSWNHVDSYFEMYRIPSEKLRLTVVRTSIIRGTVVDEKGKIIQTGRLSIELHPPGGDRVGTWSGSSPVSKKGRFEIKGIPPGEYVIGTDWRIQKGQDSPNAKPITVEAGKTYELKIVHDDGTNLIKKWWEVLKGG